MTAAIQFRTRYDTIGVGYRRHRRADPTIRAAISAALGDATRVVDVGGGTGSYEPHDRRAVAVEPSRTMIDQRSIDAAPVVQAVAERLPFSDGVFDAALAVLTVHHWQDPAVGLAELARVARRQIVVSFDTAMTNGFWLVQDYLPALATTGRGVGVVAEILNVVEVRVVPLRWDCADGLMGAYWRRPDAYLDPSVRQAISGFHRIDPSVVASAMRRLEDDLCAGRWAERHPDLLGLDELDFGLRLLVADGLTATPSWPGG